MSEQAADNLKQQMEREINAAQASQSRYMDDLAATAANSRAAQPGVAAAGDYEEPAMTVLKDKSLPPETRVEVVQRLAANISRRGDYIDALLAIVQDTTDDAAVRGVALDVLGSAAFQVARFKPHQAAFDQALRNLINDPVLALRDTAVSTLAQQHDPEVQQVLQQGLAGRGSLPVERIRAVQLLAEDDHLDNLALLQELNSSDSVDERQEAVRLMGSYPAAQDTLEAVLAIGQRRLKSGSKALLRCGTWRRTASRTSPRRSRTDTSEDSELRTACLSALQHLGDTDRVYADAAFVAGSRTLVMMSRRRKWHGWRVTSSRSDGPMGRLDGSTPEVEVGAFVDGARRVPSRHEELVALLPENFPLYDGRSGPEVTRLRGYLLASFSDISLPVSALPYVLEVLESSYECYEVAGAAIGLRGFKTPIDVAPYLFRAIDNLAGADAVVSFETYNPRWPYSVPTTALTEVIRTLALPGITSSSYAGQIEALASQRERFSAAVVAELQAALSAVNAAAVPEPEYSCCDDMAFIERYSAQPAAASGSGVVLEDQEGRRASFGEFFRGKPSVVAFFYTRCDNPNKCSLTVTKLAALQEALAGRGLTVPSADGDYLRPGIRPAAPSQAIRCRPRRALQCGHALLSYDGGFRRSGFALQPRRELQRFDR